jgi:hypothetical protein
VKKIILILFILFVTLNIFAQGPPPAPTEEEIPIAGNLFFLLMSGISYGIIKFSHHKKQKLIENNEHSI